MDIKTIREKIDHLKEIYSQPEHNTQFNQRIILTYMQGVIKKLEEIIDKDQSVEVLSEKFKSLLEKNWNLVKGSLLCYTALPDYEVTQLLCGIAKYVAEHHKNEEPITAINVLMPTIACDSLFPDKYPNLDEIDLNEVIKTHILGKNHDYLIPVSLLANIEINNSDVGRINPYYDLDQHVKDSTHISSAELNRLSEHSSETRAISGVINQYNFFLSDEASLLGQLHKLIKMLGFNSVKGIGQEESAGVGGYTAIVEFMEFYRDLDPSSIPAPVAKEIKLIQDLGSDEKKNENERVATCLATRRDDLRKSINSHEEELATITLIAEKKQSQIAQCIENFKNAGDALKQCLGKSKYVGLDQWGITTKVLIDLNIDLKFDDLDAMISALKGINVEEVSAICALADAPKKMVDVISTIENLAILFLALNDEVLYVLLNGIKNEIKTIIKSQADFAAALIPLNVTQCAVVCDALKEQLSSFIKSSSDFIDVLKFLTSEQRTIVFEALGEQLPSFIKSRSDFENLLKSLTSEQRKIFFEAVKEQLPSLIKSSADFENVLRLLTPEQCKIVCDSLKEQLPSFIKSRSDFENLLKSLTSEQRKVVCDALKEQLPSFIKSSSDFIDVLKFLTSEQCKAVCEGVKEQLPSFIKSGSDFGNLLKSLTSEQCRVVCETLKKYIPWLIKSGSDFIYVLKSLTSEQCKVVCEAIKERLPLISRFDFGDLLKQLTSEQCEAVCEGVKEQLILFIRNSFDFSKLLKQLTSEQCKAVCEALKEKLPGLIKNGSDFENLLKSLSPEQCRAVCEGVKEQLPTIIKKGSDFGNVLQFLTSEQCKVVCEVFKEQLPTIIKNDSDVENVLKQLDPEKQTIYKNIMGKAPQKQNAGTSELLQKRGFFQLEKDQSQDSSHSLSLNHRP